MKATTSLSCSQRAGLAQVGQHRPFLLAVLEGPVQLGEGEDGHVEVAGQDLEAAGQLRTGRNRTEGPYHPARRRAGESAEM
jgi:hypothetical protein